MRVSVKSFTMQRIPDDAPDLSTLGRYSNEATSPAAIDRKERGDWQRGEYRYFNPAMTGEDTGNPNSPEEDYQRAEALNRGEWSYIGVRAKVDLHVPSGFGGDLAIVTIHSPGLWGVESDSDPDYLEDVFAEECHVLKAILLALANLEVVD